LATDPSVAAAVDDAHRREWAFVLATTVRVTADLDLAEECVQHAYTKALTAWGSSGIPARPGAWLTTVAARHAIDTLRREATMRRSLPLLLDDRLEPAAGDFEVPEIGDDRLRLVFTCCHPALAVPAQVALTLRLVCGLSTGDIARAFLVSEPTMAARITRAKKKIAVARIPYRTPPAVELPARVEAVLHVVHLVFTTGHTAPSGADLVRQDLVERALDLARMLRSLLPADPDVAGLLALILLTNARSGARVTADGQLVLLRAQDRARWDRVAIAHGTALVREALSKDTRSRYTLMAAIAAVHAEARTWEDTDWDEVLGLYDLLMASWPSPVVALNRGAAVGLARGPEAGLEVLDALGGEPQLAAYPYLVSARGDFLRQLGRTDEARLCYEEALMLTENLVERSFLAGRLRELGDT
jgi:RNA polymerase sigma-70 factor (ECF subfamily)